MRFRLGPLTRHYAESGGVGDSRKETDPEVIAGAVVAWRHGLNKELPHRLDWEESPTAPLDLAAVGDTDWGAVWTLVAYGAPGRPELPQDRPTGWQGDRFVNEVLAHHVPGWPFLQIVLPRMWLPGDHDLLFRVRDLQEQEIWVGSSAQIPEQFWQLEVTWAGWLARHGTLKAGFDRTRQALETLARRSMTFNLPIVREGRI